MLFWRLSQWCRGQRQEFACSSRCSQESPPPPKLGYHSFQSLIVHMHMHMQSLKLLGFSMLFEATVAVATILIVSDAS